MGRAKIVLIVGLVVVLVVSIVVGLLCGIGSATLNMVFKNIVSKRINEVSNFKLYL